MQNITLGNIRVQILSSDIVRIEYAESGRFFDGDTFFIPDKSSYDNTEVAYSINENVIAFGDYELYIPENAKSLQGVRLEKNGKKVYSYKKLKNSGELPTLDKTPDVFPISDTPRITVPEGGYSVNRKGEYTVTENVQDIYLLLCDGDAKKLRKLYVELTGKSELVRLSTLGGWNSKYYAYSEEEAKQLILDYEKYDVPLDVMVIDTDWRSCEHGWGYDINTKLFPDMKRFMDFAHDHGVEICFNDHPEPIKGTQVFDPDEIEYRESSLQSLMEKGLDIWWYDRNWSSNLISPTPNVRWETFGLYLFTDVTERYYRSISGGDGRRPVIMGNAVNVANGYYMSILDSASHRYSVQWTGDIQSDTEALAQEVDTLVKCGNNCIPYINSDCGGHLGNPNKELFVRWMQYGVMSPVFRPHCTNYVKRFREPWAYDGETLDIVREYNNMRYRLLPVIYKNAYNSYISGEPIFKSLGFEYPGDETACRLNDEYMLGNDILIKPIAGRKYDLIRKNNFVSPIKATYYAGTELKGEPIASAEYDELNIVLNHTSPEKGVPVYHFSARFETEVQFDRDVELFVRSDDGCTVYIDGEKVFEDKTLHSVMTFPIKVISGGESHKVEIEYFQAGGEAAIVLCYCDVDMRDDKTSAYIPSGEWIDVFTGDRVRGKKYVARSYELREMPIFVRSGALIPLAYNARNTKAQKWDRLLYDFYPDKNADDEGYLYEDDGETAAYKRGKYRMSGYKAYYDKSENAFTVELDAANGEFDGERACARREIVIKYHIGADAVKKVTASGAQVQTTVVARDRSAYPFACGAAPDGDVLIAEFSADVTKKYTVKFYL